MGFFTGKHNYGCSYAELEINQSMCTLKIVHIKIKHQKKKNHIKMKAAFSSLFNEVMCHLLGEK